MKNSLFILFIAMILAFASCSMNKDTEVNSFIVDMNKLTTEIVNSVNEKPAATGVDKAQQLLDARKNELKANFEKLKSVRGFQFSEQMKQKFTEAVAKDVEAVNTLQIKYADKTVTDKSFGQKLNKLSADFNSIFGV